MRIRTLLLVIVAVALGATGTVVGVSVASASSDAGPVAASSTHFRVVAIETDVADGFQKDPSSSNPGDTRLMEQTLYDNTVGRVGNDFVVCVRTFSLERMCDIHIGLIDRGSIVAKGVLPFARTTSFDAAVLGGTGEFRDVRGMLRVYADEHTDTWGIAFSLD